jgi:hypothetical protein
VFDIEKEEKTELMDLKSNKTFVYHMKLHGNKVIYVKNTKEVMVLDMETADERCLGKANSQILALHVFDKKVTTLDREVMLREGIEIRDIIDDEENKEQFSEGEDNFRVVTIDSKARINLFVSENGNDYKHLFDIKKATKFPDELLDKDFFSMGYPYLITAYYNMVAFSSDYGVCLFKFDDSLLNPE